MTVLELLLPGRHTDPSAQPAAVGQSARGRLARFRRTLGLIGERAASATR